MHFNGRFVLNLVQFAAYQGADKNELVALTGLGEDDLCLEDCRLGAELYDAVVETAVERTKDNYLGLHAGENMNLQAAGLILQIAHSSDTVKQALMYCCDFANLGCSALPTTLEEENNCYKLTLTPNAQWLNSSPLSVLHTVYGYLAFTIREFHSLTRDKHQPKEIWLTTKAPHNAEELHRVLNCPLKFEMDQFAILFEKQHVEEKVVTSDYNLLSVLVSHAQKKLNEFDDNHGFYDTVKRSIVNLVRPQFPTIDEVAGHLNMSVRTFQRRLSDEGFSFKDLMDELRKDFAISYLEDHSLSISEVAYLLNYSDASTFIRSFKRWTGQTPKAFRQNTIVL